jgi:hypothetical protein
MMFLNTGSFLENSNEKPLIIPSKVGKVEAGVAATLQSFDLGSSAPYRAR